MIQRVTKDSCGTLSQLNDKWNSARNESKLASLAYDSRRDKLYHYDTFVLFLCLEYIVVSLLNIFLYRWG